MCQIIFFSEEHVVHTIYVDILLDTFQSIVKIHNLYPVYVWCWTHTYSIKSFCCN